MTAPSEAAVSGDRSLRGAVRWVMLLNLAYFGVEFSVAVAIASVSLFADSIDFLEDASVNALVLMALGWSSRARIRVARFMALLLLAPGIVTLWTAWQKLQLPIPPEPLPFSVAAAGALAVNFGCAYLLARHRTASGSLSRAAFLSARNDAIANVAMIGAALVTLATMSAWPDLIVGLAIAALNAGAAKEVWEAAGAEGAPK